VAPPLPAAPTSSLHRAAIMECAGARLLTALALLAGLASCRASWPTGGRPPP